MGRDWTVEDGARECGSPEWWAWSKWCDLLEEAMRDLKIPVPSPHGLLDEFVRFLPQECEICRHHTEVMEQLVGQAWENH